MNFKQFVTEALGEGSKIAQGYFGNVTGSTKPGDNNQVLTEADIAIGKHIISLIEKAYPDHNIIDEEAGVIDKKSNYTWVIDPIDGTSNFAVGVPTYGVMLGLLENDIPVAGGIALPAFNQLNIAEKENGAFCNEKKISVTKETNLQNALVAYGIDPDREHTEHTFAQTLIMTNLVLATRNIRISNSVFDAIMLAQGGYGGFLTQSTKIWDNVGMQIVLEEAGALYTDFFGNPMDYTHHLQRAQENFTMCAAPPQLHPLIQNIVHERTN